MLAIILTIGVTIASLPFIRWFLYLRKMKSLMDIPGPKPLPILGNILDIGNNPSDLLLNMHKLSKQYNGIYKIFVGPSIRVVLARPELLEPLLTSHVNITKSSGYDLTKPWLGNGLLISTGNKWRKRRKLVAPAFHFQSMEKFLKSFSLNADVLIQKLEKEAGNERVDLKPYISNYSLDVMCDTLMGINIKAQYNQNLDFVTAVRKFLDILTIRFFSIWEKSNLLFRLSKRRGDFQNSLKILHHFTNEVVRSKQSQNNFVQDETLDDYGTKKKIVLLDLLLSHKKSNNLSDEDVREEIDNFIFAGHDTVSSALTFILYALAKNPEIQKKSYEEIVEVLDHLEDNAVSTEEVSKLKYLEMVIKEGLRLYTSVPMIGRKLEEDITIDGRTYPAGITVMMFLYAMQHSEEFYPEPEKFDPDRFLPENVSNRSSFLYLPFSAGARNCIGQKYAMLEMKVLLAKLLRNFRLLPVPGFEPLLGMSIILQSYNGVYVSLERRK